MKETRLSRDLRLALDLLRQTETLSRQCAACGGRLSFSLGPCREGHATTCRLVALLRRYEAGA